MKIQPRFWFNQSWLPSSDWVNRGSALIFLIINSAWFGPVWLTPLPYHRQNLMLSCVLAIKTILFLGSLNNLKCSERIRHVPPGDQTISAGGALGQRSTVPKQLVCLVSLSELKINFISERTGTGGGRRVGSGGRQLEEYPRLALSFPPLVCHSYSIAA